MITVESIIETKSLDLFNKAMTLKYGLYKLSGIKVACLNSPFRQTIIHYENSAPIAYSNDTGELYEYADKLGLSSFEVTESHCYRNNSK